MNKRCIETAALAAFRKDSEKIRVEMINSVEENEETKDNYDISLLINHLPMNLKLVLLKPTKLDEVSTFSGSSVTVKGRYIPPEEKNIDVSKDQFLNLHIEGPNKQSILLALQMIEHLVKDSTGLEENTPFGQVEKVLVGMEVAPAEFDLRGRVLGPEGSNLQYINSETEAEVTLRGRGSGYKEPDIGKESPEPLHIRIQHARPEVVQAGRILAFHLVETVQEEFAEYCSQQAQLMVTPQPVSFPAQKTPPSPLSDVSWSPSGHSAYMEYDGELDVWLGNRASPLSNTSYKGSSSENVEEDDQEPNKPKQSVLEEKKEDVDQKEDEKKMVEISDEEKKSEKDTEKTDTEKPGEHVRWSLKRKRRGGRKTKVYREKIIKYTETLEKLQNKNLQPEAKKKLVEIINVLKPKLASWWYIKRYGENDLKTQYVKICVEREHVQKQKQIPPSKQSSLQVCAPENIHRPRIPLLPVPRPMPAGYMTPPTSSRPPLLPPPAIPRSIPVSFQSSIKTPGILPTMPKPPAAMGKPCYVPRPTSSAHYSQNNQPTVSAISVSSQSCHSWLPNQPTRGQQNNLNFVGVTQGKQWSETQAPQNYNYDQGNRWKINQRPPLQNPSQNTFSQDQWLSQPSPQNFQGPNRYLAPNHQSSPQNVQGPKRYLAPNHQSIPQDVQGPNLYPASNYQSSPLNFKGPNLFPISNQNFSSSWGQQNQVQPGMGHHLERWQSPTQISKGIPRAQTAGFWQNR